MKEEISVPNWTLSAIEQGTEMSRIIESDVFLYTRYGTEIILRLLLLSVADWTTSCPAGSNEMRRDWNFPPACLCLETELSPRTSSGFPTSKLPEISAIRRIHSKPFQLVLQTLSVSLQSQQWQDLLKLKYLKILTSHKIFHFQEEKMQWQGFLQFFFKFKIFQFGIFTCCGSKR